MKQFATFLLAMAFVLPMAAYQETQQPTANPGAAQQRTPEPASPGTGQSQQNADVPRQQPDTKSPNMSEQRNPKAKKKSKKSKATDTTSTKS